MRGRLSIGLTFELVENAVDNGSAELEWTETAIAVPFGYEIPAEQSGLSQVHSLLLYAGPLYSRLDGDLTSAGVRLDLDEDKDFGLLAGADIFLAQNLAIGGQIQYFDEISFNVSARYHF